MYFIIVGFIISLKSMSNEMNTVWKYKPKDDLNSVSKSWYTMRMKAKLLDLLIWKVGLNKSNTRSITTSWWRRNEIFNSRNVLCYVVDNHLVERPVCCILELVCIWNVQVVCGQNYKSNMLSFFMWNNLFIFGQTRINSAH